MLVINSIEKSRLQGDSFSYSGSGVAWKARFVLFLGFALLAGGLAGSVVRPSTAGGVSVLTGQTVMVLKYLVKNYPLQTLYFGIANIVANGLIMLRFVPTPVRWTVLTEYSTVVLWISQNMEDDYTYTLAL